MFFTEARIVKRRFFDAIAGAGALTLLAGAAALAPAQTHKHYGESEEAAKASPTGQIAPRLQNLGSHAFPVTTRS